MEDLGFCFCVFFHDIQIRQRKTGEIVFRQGFPAGFENADVHAQENWGTKVHESADGRSAIFVRDFGNGFQIFTFVIWAQ